MNVFNLILLITSVFAKNQLVLTQERPLLPCTQGKCLLDDKSCETPIEMCKMKQYYPLCDWLCKNLNNLEKNNNVRHYPEKCRKSNLKKDVEIKELFKNVSTDICPGPIIQAAQKDYKFVLNSTEKVIRCKVTKMYSSSKVKWKLNGTEINKNNDDPTIQGAILVFGKVKKENSGNYSCHYDDSRWTDEDTLNVQIIAPESQPELISNGCCTGFIICLVIISVLFIILLVLIGILCANKNKRLILHGRKPFITLTFQNAGSQNDEKIALTVRLNSDNTPAQVTNREDTTAVRLNSDNTPAQDVRSNSDNTPVQVTNREDTTENDEQIPLITNREDTTAVRLNSDNTPAQVTFQNDSSQNGGGNALNVRSNSDNTPVQDVHSNSDNTPVQENDGGNALNVCSNSDNTPVQETGLHHIVNDQENNTSCHPTV